MQEEKKGGLTEKKCKIKALSKKKGQEKNKKYNAKSQLWVRERGGKTLWLQEVS